jgi:hypothetical protein
MGFDDDDRLCVVQYGERGFCAKIPNTLVAWSEREMEIANVTPRQAHPQQLRFARGAGGSLMNSRTPADRDEVVRKLSEYTGIKPENFKNILNGTLMDFDFGQDFPIKIGQFDSGSFPFAYVAMEDSNWCVFHGTIEPTEDGDAYVTQKASVGDKRRTRGGTVHAFASDKVEGRIESAIEWLEKRKEILAEQSAKDEDLPDGP